MLQIISIFGKVVACARRWALNKKSILSINVSIKSRAGTEMAKRKAESATSEAKSTKKPTRQQTAPSISICVPSSVISSKNAYNLQQKTMIAYQIAKASLIYDVAEIIVLTELTTKQEGKGGQSEEEKKDISSSIGKKVVFDDNGENDIGSSAPVENPTDTVES